jgi:hypothetical protein
MSPRSVHQGKEMLIQHILKTFMDVNADDSIYMALNYAGLTHINDLTFFNEADVPTFQYMQQKHDGTYGLMFLSLTDQHKLVTFIAWIRFLHITSGRLSTPEQWWCRLTVEEYHTYCTRNGYDVPIPTMSTTTASSFLTQPPA